MPPRQAIADWINAKGIIPKGDGGKLPTVDQLSFLIARRIGRDGLPASNTLEKTLDGMEKHIEDKLTNALRADVEENITN